MAEPNVIPGDLQVKGSAQFGTLSLPASTVTNTMVSATAAIDASKLLHMVNQTEQLFGPTTTVTALSYDVYIGKGIGTLTAFRAFITTVASGADRTITVDLHKSTAGGAFATVLSGTIGFTNVSAVRTLVSGTISPTAYVAGDLFRVIVSVAGAAGAQALGLTAALVTYEATT